MIVFQVFPDAEGIAGMFSRPYEGQSTTRVVASMLIHSRFVKFPLPALAEEFHIRAFAQALLRPKIDSNTAAYLHIGGSPHIES